MFLENFTLGLTKSIKHKSNNQDNYSCLFVPFMNFAHANMAFFKKNISLYFPLRVKNLAQNCSLFVFILHITVTVMHLLPHINILQESNVQHLLFGANY